ncbi:class I SAM-dependent methyltransferase [Runella slithyformis]|uniref:Methyltransferase type 11 n=1 Tax=Runella slithyformis (strain ATCC 29530 / DSM 19594 / LMG 11500 / NCIMB 11436 / LSU 4) TaxID=761193 RepID=A0A7U3ZJI6_RUNSL|nr:class I SAM-dependent methyltransferase [Runella slithyformis]AEI48379.1 Methyltransferase type 11 [Runella slithyformis DSM 19594]
MEDSKRIVQEGYDRLGSRYRTHYEKSDPERYRHWLNELTKRLPARANVLELGCADGIPTARILSQHFVYRGIDLSPVQIKQARRNVPKAHFEVADMTALTFPEAAFEAVIALYSIIHVPLAEQPALINAVYRWLRPDGCFLCVVGDCEWTGTEPDWIEPGLRMYWSHTDADTYQSWFIETGFTVIERHFAAEGATGHTFFFLQK